MKVLKPKLGYLRGYSRTDIVVINHNTGVTNEFANFLMYYYYNENNYQVDSSKLIKTCEHFCNHYTDTDNYCIILTRASNITPTIAHGLAFVRNNPIVITNLRFTGHYC